MVRMRDSRPLPSWNGWIARNTTANTPIATSGCASWSSSAALVHATSSAMSRGVSNGAAVSNTVPTGLPSPSNATMLFGADL